MAGLVKRVKEPWRNPYLVMLVESITKRFAFVFLAKTGQDM